MGEVFSFPIDLSENDKEIIRPYFSNLDKHVFALMNLPEVIKGTLFSRYSRSDKSARRLLLDEFIANKDVLQVIKGNVPIGTDSNLSVQRAEDFYQRVLVGYGDDSVAELAGGHIACENVSSLAGDILTDSRIGISPLEKSGRYIPFDKKVDGKYLWYRDSNIMNSKFASAYTETMDTIFDLYSKWIPIVMSYIKEANPRTPDTTERAYESATRAKACDVLKNMLPAGRLTNVGLFGNGRAFEYMLTKLYSSELPEGREIAKQMHTELAVIMPAFVKRSQTSDYITQTRSEMDSFVKRNLPSITSGSQTEPFIKLIDYDKDAEIKVLSAMLYPYSGISIEKLRETVNSMSMEKRKELVTAYLSKRRNRRDKPGRALENTFYTFDVCANYGIFRDLHRHRQLSIEKQRLTTHLGYDVPKELEFVSLDKEYAKLMDRVDSVYRSMEVEMPIEAQYIVSRSFHMLWYMKMNLREVHHMTELRSIKQGHYDYRKIAQNMKIEVEKVHPSLVAYMQVDMNEYALPRIESEKRIDQKLSELDKKEHQ